MARLLRSHQEGQLDAEPLCHCKSVHHQRAANAARTPSGFDRKSNLHRQKKGAPWLKPVPKAGRSEGKPQERGPAGARSRARPPNASLSAVRLPRTYRHLRPGLTDSYLHGYTSINSQRVIDLKMPNAHDVLFRTLADPTRRAIFERLCREGEQTVGALTARAGVSQPAVSKHLGVLKQAGLVRDRHEGRQTHYSAQLGALAPLIDWTSQMAGFWQNRFDKLEDLLKRMDQ